MIKELKTIMELMEKLKKIHQEAARILKEKGRVEGRLIIDGYQIDFVIKEVEDAGRK